MADDFGAAALRHLRDGEMLAKGKRWGGAGHLIGFAAECAIKQGILTLRQRQNAPQGHFPEIIDIAKRHLAGRRNTGLYIVLKLPDLMRGWQVSLRYAGDAAVGQAEYDLWRDHAVWLAIAVNLRRK
jgi:hypothetical protein